MNTTEPTPALRQRKGCVMSCASSYRLTGSPRIWSHKMPFSKGFLTQGQRAALGGRTNAGGTFKFVARMDVTVIDLLMLSTAHKVICSVLRPFGGLQGY